MSFNMLQPLTRSEAASAARTATGNSGTLTLPQGRSYTWILDVTAASGGNDCTCDVAIQMSPQSPGTPSNWYNVAAFRQVLQATFVDFLRISPTAGMAEAGAEWLAWSSSSGGPIAINAPITRKYRILWTMQGAAPSYTFAIWLVVVPKGSIGL